MNLSKEDWISTTAIYLAESFGKNVPAEVYLRYAERLHKEYTADYFYWTPEDAVEDYLYFTKGELL